MNKKINFSENRNVYMPNERMKKIMSKIHKNIFEYPDYKNIVVNKSISTYFDINELNLTVTNGSLEGINLLINVLNKKETVLFTPTFWGYENAFNRFNYSVKKEGLVDGLEYDLEKISLMAKKYKVIVLCNPNNPTLSYITKEQLLKIVEENPQCHFIIDETMLIFDENYDLKTVSKSVENKENLSVVVSFSKFLGIAGLRTGAVFSNKKIIEKVKHASIPYSFGIIQQTILPAALEDPDFLSETRKLITNNRKNLCAKLKEIGCSVIDGNTNFVLLKLPQNIDANKITDYLYEYGLEVRNIKESYPELNGDWLRISIQTAENNKILVKKIESYINNKI